MSIGETLYSTCIAWSWLSVGGIRVDHTLNLLGSVHR
jgi:hypothetical protein